MWGLLHWWELPGSPLRRHVFPQCTDQTAIACSECLPGLSGTFHFIPSSLLQLQLFSPQQSLCPWGLAPLGYSVCGPVFFLSGNHTGQGCSSATHCVPWANGLTFHPAFCLQSRGNSCVWWHSVDVKSLHHLKIFRASTTCWPCSRTGEDLALVNVRAWWRASSATRWHACGYLLILNIFQFKKCCRKHFE